jgi:hypothetical protein
MKSASLCSLAGRYDNPIPPRLLAPIDCLKIPALATQPGGIDSLESILGLLKSLKILALYLLVRIVQYSMGKLILFAFIKCRTRK